MPHFSRAGRLCFLGSIFIVGCQSGHTLSMGSGTTSGSGPTTPPTPIPTSNPIPIPPPSPVSHYNTVSTAYAREPLTPELCKRGTTYYIDQRCTADGDKVYVAKSIAGITDSTGGPTGTTATIANPLVDGTVHWVYAGSLSAMRVFYACDCQDKDAAGGADSSCQAGKDSNDGTSPDTAWQSWVNIAKAYNRETDDHNRWMSAGDTVALCRGGKWRVPAGKRLANDQCTAANPCTIRDYGQGFTPILALIANGDALSLFDLENGGDARHKEGLRILNLDLENNGVAGAWGVYLYNDQDYVTLGNLVINGFNIAVHVAGGSSSEVRNDHLTLIGSMITGNRTQGWLGGGNGQTLFANYFYNNGSDTDRDHTIYTGGGKDYLIANNEIYAGWNEACVGVVIIAHQPYDGITIEGNTIEVPNQGTTDRCWGIAIDNIGHGPNINPGEPSGNVARGVIRRNTIRNAGGLGIGVANSVNALVEDNLVIQDDQSDQWPIVGISVPDAWSAQDGNSPGTENTGSIVQNNTVYFSAKAPGGTGIRVGGNQGKGEGRNYQVVNNAVFYEGSRTNGFSCFSYTQPANAYDLIDYNLCDAPNAGGDNAIWEEISRNTFAVWKTAHGNFDQHSFLIDPQFVNVGERNFTPAAGSPLVGNADPDQYSSIDLTGADRDSAPDIGAIERR